MDRTERLLDLITYLLNAREPVSWRAIRSQFPEDYEQGIEESKQRKFERDKAELVSLGIPIDYQPASEGKSEGYVIRKEKLFLPEVRFSPRECSLLMLAAEAVLHEAAFPYRDQLESALHKILSLQPTLTAPPDGVAIRCTPATASPDPDMVRKIRDALERRKTLTLRYHAFSTGKTTQRKVNPYGLVFRRGKWTLVGWDHMRKDIRQFVLNRIARLEVNPRRPGSPDYEVPSDFCLHVYSQQQPWHLECHEPEDVVLEIAPHRQNELLPQLLGAEELGGRRFRITVTNRAALMAWILEQKTDVRVVSPESIRKDLIQLLRKLA
ncbi:MAG TPA: WYL domain-containing protein [Acidobacteriota bacterium]|nr:WYL domain-containing protein [Acidobacteriota bacterium]